VRVYPCWSIPSRHNTASRLLVGKSPRLHQQQAVHLVIAVGLVSLLRPNIHLGAKYLVPARLPQQSTLPSVRTAQVTLDPVATAVAIPPPTVCPTAELPPVPGTYYNSAEPCVNVVVVAPFEVVLAELAALIADGVLRRASSTPGRLVKYKAALVAFAHELAKLSRRFWSRRKWPHSR
jgi:hypothetical protein